MSDPKKPAAQNSDTETIMDTGRSTGSHSASPKGQAPPLAAGSVQNSQAETIADDGGSTVSYSMSPEGHAPIFEIGSVIAGRYQVLALLGKGGMGAVYKTHDRDLDRVVALKVIRPELASNTNMSQRFKQEIILAREVTHRNIVRMYDLGKSDETAFVTMEFMEGETLAQALDRRGKLPVDEAVTIMRQVCDGLAAAHNNHIVHRDLKPANIMCTPEGRIIIMDFGLARDVAADHLTQTGMVLGTIDYMSPEQSHGETVDARSDLFAVGLILYELLTGARPFSADSAVATLIKRSQERAKPPSTIDPTIPQAVDAIVMRCLETDPANRYKAATEILADLEAWQRGAHIAARTIARRWRARLHWWHAAVPALVAVVVLGALLIPRLRLKPAVQHPAMSVLVGDFTNRTGDPVFDGTMEPMINIALEGASFVSAFNRGTARDLARQLPTPSDKLDEQPARLVAVNQGISTVITGEISRREGNYSISARALDAVSGRVLAKASVATASKDEVLLAVPKLVAPMRKALGDTTPESVQMESAGGFTAASLETVQQYSLGMEQQSAGKMDEAIKSFSNAVRLDPNFARAYSGMAAAYRNLDRLEDAEKYIKMALTHVDRLTERERYRIRGSYYIIIENWQKCVEECSEVIRRYPGDNIGHNNLSLCSSKLRHWARAVEEARKAVQNQPKAAGWRVNLSLFSCYSGNFPGCEREARELQKLNPDFAYGHLALAFAQLGQGQLSAAAETYRKLEKISTFGASWAAAGLADLALYEGRFADAKRILEQGIAADRKVENLDAMANKFVTLAYLELGMQHKQPALAAAEKALAGSQAAKIKFLAAQIFVDAGEVAKARELAAKLASGLSAEPQAYAKIIEGTSALKGGDAPQAIKILAEANNLLDTWIGRFELGRAYLQANGFAEADSEFDRCIARRGEALSLFLDEAPTYGYLPLVYYYQGRVREGLKSPGFAESYRKYLSIRGQAGEDPLLPEVRRRAGQ
jgi:eukaryotic-like serine/threonine-protein kinase